MPRPPRRLIAIRFPDAEQPIEVPIGETFVGGDARVTTVVRKIR